MKREVKRERALPAFELDVGEFGALWQRLEALMGESDAFGYSNLDIKLRNETLKYDSFEELTDLDALPDRVTNFSLWMRRGDRQVSLRSASLFWTRPEISAEGESEAWCAGAVETVVSYLDGHKKWYYWLVAAPLGWLLVLGIYGVPAVLAIAQKIWVPDFQLPRVAVYGWVGGVIALGLLYASRATVFPQAILRVRETRGFIRRNVAELSLVVALASAVISVIGWFVAK